MAEQPAAPAVADAELRGAAGLLALLLFVSYAYFVSPPSWNENSRFNLVRSLVERRRLDIDPYHQITGDKSFRDGHHYSDKAPGTALVAAAPYALYHGMLKLTGRELPVAFRDASFPDPARTPRAAPDEPRYQVNASFQRGLYLCNLFTNALGGAVLGGLFFLTATLRLRVAARPALVATVALGLGSLVFPYATMFYGHVLAAAFLFGAFWLAGAATGPPLPARRLAAAGALAGMAVLTELPCVVPALALGAYLLWAGRGRAAGWFLVGLLPPVLLLLAYQQAAFGSPFRPGYALVSSPVFAAGMSEGVMGVGVPRPRVLAAILFGRQRGLFYLAPVLALAAVGLGLWLKRAWPDRERRAQALFAVFVVGFFLLLNAGYYMWYGGSALGPRHVIPALPFLCLGLLFVWPRAQGGPARAGRVGLVALLVLSVANHLAATATEPAAPMVPDVLRDHVYLHLLRGEVPAVAGASTLAAGLGLRGWPALLPLVGLWGLALAVLIPQLPRAPADGIIHHPGDDRQDGSSGSGAG